MAAPPLRDSAFCMLKLTKISNSTYGGGGRLKDKRYRPKPNHIGKYKTLRHRLNAHFQAISAQPPPTSWICERLVRGCRLAQRACDSPWQFEGSWALSDRVRGQPAFALRPGGCTSGLHRMRDRATCSRNGL